LLTNLVDNAINYPPRAARAAVVQIATAPAEDGTQAWARVSDNGPGIPAEHLPHLFERFYRADAARTAHDGGSSTSGSGLGLAIVQWIAHIHGGDVRAESRLGEGSTFIVHLPLAK
jgi:signal transduction histidine kinase